MTALIDMNNAPVVKDEAGNCGRAKLAIEAHCAWDDFGHYLCVYMKNPFDNRPMAQPKEVQFQECTPGEQKQPLLRMDLHESQALMDALWSIGVRPSHDKLDDATIGDLKKRID